MHAQPRVNKNVCSSEIKAGDVFVGIVLASLPVWDFHRVFGNEKHLELYATLPTISHDIL